MTQELLYVLFVLLQYLLRWDHCICHQTPHPRSPPPSSNSNQLHQTCHQWV